MAMTLNWFARIVDDKGAAVSGLKVDLELFNLDKAAWETVQGLATAADGKLAGKAEIAVDALSYAPAIRLVETGTTAVLSSTPQVTRSGRPPVLNADFGEITRLPVESRVAPVAAATRKLSAGTFTIAGVSSPLVRNLVTPAKGSPSQAKTAGGSVAAATINVNELKANITAEVSKTFADRLDESQRIVAERDTALKARIREIADRDAQISKIREQLAGVTAENERLRQKAAAAAAAGSDGTKDQGLPLGPVAMARFASSIGEDLHSAQATLAKSSFSIGRFEVNAKALLGNDGTIQLAGKDTTVDTGKLADVKLEFQPGVEADPSLGIQVPDVAQLTESAARRVLASVGLQLQPSYGPRSLSPDSAPGQAMVQTPRAGETAARGAQVLVIFASA